MIPTKIKHFLTEELTKANSDNKAFSKKSESVERNRINGIEIYQRKSYIIFVTLI